MRTTEARRVLKSLTLIRSLKRAALAGLLGTASLALGTVPALANGPSHNGQHAVNRTKQGVSGGAHCAPPWGNPGCNNPWPSKPCPNPYPYPSPNPYPYPYPCPAPSPSPYPYPGGGYPQFPSGGCYPPYPGNCNTPAPYPQPYPYPSGGYGGSSNSGGWGGYGGSSKPIGSSNSGGWGGYGGSAGTIGVGYGNFLKAR